MTLQAKIAERLREERDGCYEMGHAQAGRAVHHVSCLFAEGLFDDIIGVPSPSIDDVRREAVRVFGPAFNDEVGEHYGIVAVGTTFGYEDWPEVTTPTIAATYAALRALPDKVTP